MPFQKGQSGNPSGKPADAKMWSDALRRAIKRRQEEDPQALEKLADNLLAFASSKVASEALPAIKELADRLDGKPHQSVDMTTRHERPVSEWDEPELDAAITELKRVAGKAQAGKKPEISH